MKKILGIGTLALAGVLAFAGCSVKDEDGKAWAEENGYVKYEDTFTSSSIKPSSYAGLYEKEEKLAQAMAKGTHGQYLHNTINPDGSVHTAYFIYSIKKNADTSKWEISQYFGVNEDGSPNQTVSNLLRNGEGTAVYISHGFNELVAVYGAVSENSAPTWEANKYYKLNDNNYTLTTTEPTDWTDAYDTYYTLAYVPVNLAHDADKNEAVAAQMYYTVKSHEVIKSGDKVTGYKFVLEIQNFAPIS